MEVVGGAVVISHSTVASLAKNSKYFSLEKERTHTSHRKNLSTKTDKVRGEFRIWRQRDSGGSGAACKAESIIESGEITKYSVWGKGNGKDSIQDCFMLLFAPVYSEL
jgi:hypothetical protein